ncbi:putative xyloglucan endotransglucosylase/hydrolase protein 32 [Canna indica]|uniref:xyloglucan:xyloglucosyl transferase n=1 Tax=Canna indica TaxID=4628 RepID=A0AAQ3KJV6_9LILI|nr:putative xyloglucan endotransglucosylase/hydrolase protein 32 [Canna indica]
MLRGRIPALAIFIPTLSLYLFATSLPRARRLPPPIFDEPTFGGADETLGVDDDEIPEEGKEDVEMLDAETLDGAAKKGERRKTPGGSERGRWRQSKNRQVLYKAEANVSGEIPNNPAAEINQYERIVELLTTLLPVWLLSSNELWMYALIAYNGMSLELDTKDLNIPINTICIPSPLPHPLPPLSPSSPVFMALLIAFFLLLNLLAVDAQPSPGYSPSSSLQPIKFTEGFSNLWGPQHQTISSDQYSATIWLDSSSGSGFKSNNAYRSGYFGASIKLQSGYTAGTNTAFYLSNNQAYPGFHDEVDIEFLGNIEGRPYTLQTNVYVRGSGDGRIIGREMRFHLWFDPTADFHHYAILYNPDEIIFFVDDVPVRRYARKIEATFPERQMWVYGSIWDASTWATDNGRYRTDYRYEPFVAKYTDFMLGGCPESASASCRAVSSSPSGDGLSAEQMAAMQWAQSNYMIYYYCQDSTRDHSLTPEC